MSGVHAAHELYCNVRDLAAQAGIDAALIRRANDAYANQLLPLVNKARFNPVYVPSLHDAIMALPNELIRIFNIGSSHETLREAVMALPAEIMDALNDVINFELADAK